MSLKAKIEAVIYAAEEPVTLTQLAGLFAEEVFARPEKAIEEDAPVPAVPVESLIEAGIIETGFFDTGGFSAGGTADNDVLTIEALAGTDKPDADDKRAARQRDREVREQLRQMVAELIDEYARGDRGMEVREIAGGYRIATKPEYHDAVRAFVKSLKPPMKLSLQALETLAVIAYKQPVTAPEVGEIRGVDSAGVLGSLVSRKLITTAGRKPVIGRPILYKTTKEFLLRFGLKDLNELPSIEEFEKMAGEIEIDDEPTAQKPALPFAQNGAETDEAEALEENAGEPGVSVANQAEDEPAPHAVSLDAAPPPVSGTAEIKVMPATHPDLGEQEGP